MADIYTKKMEIDYTICQKCGADRWPNTVNCPVCGAKYAEKTSTNTYSASGYGTKPAGTSASGTPALGTATTKNITQAGSAKYNKKTESFENGNMYQSPYERGVYDKKPEAKSRMYGGLGIPVGLIIKIVLVVAVVVSIIIIVTRVTSGYVDEQKEKEAKAEKMYQELIDDARSIVDENNRAIEERANQY